MTTYLGTASGATPGIEGDTTVSTANGVKGTSSTGASAVYGEANGGGAGTHGYSTASSGYALYGTAATGGTSTGLYGEGNYGVYGECASLVGVAATPTSTSGYGVLAVNTATSNATGIMGDVGSPSSSAYAVYGHASGSAHAGYFDGKIYARSASASIKAFVIDHPLDPENRLLRHFSVESSERKNVYDGIAVADSDGVAAISLPRYFEALNEAVQYQLTALGQPAPALHVKAECSAGKFVIGGANPGQRICWQVTGNRKDAFARANPLLVEEEKGAEQRGSFLTPEAHGQPSSKAISAAARAYVPARPAALPSP